MKPAFKNNRNVNIKRKNEPRSIAVIESIVNIGSIEDQKDIVKDAPTADQNATEKRGSIEGTEKRGSIEDQKDIVKDAPTADQNATEKRSGIVLNGIEK